MAIRKSTWFVTALTPRVGPVDARVFLLLPVFFLYMRPITLILLLTVVVVFTLVDFVVGHRLPTVITAIRTKLATLFGPKLVITQQRLTRR